MARERGWVPRYSKPQQREKRFKKHERKKVLKGTRGKDSTGFLQAEHSPQAREWSVKEEHWRPSPCPVLRGSSCGS